MATETALLKVLADIYGAIDRQQVTLLGLLDLSAAFDCVDHDILLRRLRHEFGICTVVGIVSARSVTAGVLQGMPIRVVAVAFRSATRVCSRPSVIPVVHGRAI